MAAASWRGSQSRWSSSRSWSRSSRSATTARAKVGARGRPSSAGCDPHLQTDRALRRRCGQCRWSPQALLAHGDSLWIATPRNVVRLNLRNGSTIARIPIPTDGVNAGLAFGAGSIWLAATGKSQLLRIDPSSDRLVAKIRLDASRNGRVRPLGGGVAFAAGRVWVSRDSSGPRGDVVAVNPATNRAGATPVTVGTGPDAIVSGFGSLWVDNTSVVVGNNAPSRTYPAVSGSIHGPAA